MRAQRAQARAARTTHLDERARVARRAHGDADEPLRSDAARLLARDGDALLPEPVERALDVATLGVQRRLALGHGRARPLAQRAHERRGRRHGERTDERAGQRRGQARRAEHGAQEGRH
jgi:hypothetical protein